MARRLRRGFVASVVLLTAALANSSTLAASFVSLQFGVGFDSQRLRLVRPTSSVTNLDWPVHVLAHYRNVRAGDGWEFAVTPPDGAFTWSWTPRTSRDYSDYYLVHLIPLAGTPNEERTGTWRVTVSHQGNQQQAQFDVVAADRSALEAAKAEQAARPQDFVANYRLGAAASMFGEDELAVSSLSRAAEIARRNPYPHVALCRHFLRTQQKEQARQACATARGLLLGYDDRSLSGWLLREIESLLRQAD
ncbi:hypothetical protein HRbin32_00370 [bacterium HR32]|nr:hypothetical protein HRbin32_00370 [bacterium HR32]